LVNYYLASERN